MSANKPLSPDLDSAPTKRTRVLFSCVACRASKLKCDRLDPCGQCLKKGKPEACRYAPRPSKAAKPAKSMTARLKRLEGMVRGMLDEDGRVPAPRPGGGVPGAGAQEGENGSVAGSDAGGHVVRGNLGATSYVGGTHFAAILQDIDELKNYFEYPEDEEVDASGDPYEAAEASEFLLLSQNGPRNREELLSLLPEKSIIDRLIMQYFSSNSPSQHILHRPTFNKEYSKFWEDPNTVSLHWIAILLMVISLGVFFSCYANPHELETNSPMPAMDRFRTYRGAAGTALIWGKYSQPNQWTIQAMLLYVEAEFLVARRYQINCYLLSSVLIRLMLKMGLHRDPDKLPNISPYDGEMRRRSWNLAIQIDLLAAFHLGLPAMIHGIESDTTLPRNLFDSDFSQDSKELPPARPTWDHTPLSHAISKAAVCRVFGLVARQVHSLKVPTYEEVMKLDAILEETYNDMPGFLRVKPLEESIADPPMRVVQRFGLAGLYQKTRCVLHRKYITDAIPKKEHDYSRRVCLSAALALLKCQRIAYEACQPGGLLGPNGWFLSAMAVNDFLLADMVVALVIQSEQYPKVSDKPDWLNKNASIPTKDELLAKLQKSLFIWQQMATKVPDCKKAADLVGTVIHKIEVQMGVTPDTAPDSEMTTQTSEESESMAGLTIDSQSKKPATGLENDTFDLDTPAFFRYPAPSLIYANTENDTAPWMLAGPNDYDWTQFDAFTHGSADQEFELPDQTQSFPTRDQPWLDRDPLDELDFITRTMTGTTSLGLR